MGGRADRQRRYRARQRCGEAMVRVRLNYHQVVDALLESTRLSEAEALNRARVEEALAIILTEWAGRQARK